MLPKPRYYQERGLELTRKAYKDGYRKILFFLATGGGKSVIFLHMVKNLLDSNKPTILVMRRRQLVFQAQKHFNKYGIQSSIMMSNQKEFDPSKNLQICSIDTIARRKDLDFLKRFYAVIIDEAHDTTSPSYRKFLNKLNVELFIGLTATPFKIGNKVHDFWECCVKPIEIDELVKEKYLTECSIYVPSKIDLSDIKIVNGDYHEGQLAERMSRLEIIGDVVNSYKKFGKNRPAICFGVNKEHSMKLCIEFNQAGIPAIHCDESTKQKDRDRAIKMLREGEIKIINNVNIFSTGVDIPEAMIGLMARPTKSEVLYIQQIGRLLRPYRKCGKCKSSYDNSEKCYICGYDKPEFIKESAIIIDNGNNIERHGHPFKVRYAILSEKDYKKKERVDSEEFHIKTCKFCFAAYSSNRTNCPECNAENDKIQREIKKADGKIVPYDEFNTIKTKLNYYERIKIEKGLKTNFPFFKIYEDFGEVVYDYPDLKIPKWVGSVFKKNKEEEQRNMYS